MLYLHEMFNHLIHVSKSMRTRLPKFFFSLIHQLFVLFTCLNILGTFKQKFLHFWCNGGRSWCCLIQTVLGNSIGVLLLMCADPRDWLEKPVESICWIGLQKYNKSYFTWGHQNNSISLWCEVSDLVRKLADLTLALR